MSYLKLTNCNYDQLQQSINCICIYCLDEFKSVEVIDFIKEQNNKKTAICPHCSVDSVLGNSDKYSKQQIQKWHDEGFGTN